MKVTIVASIFDIVCNGRFKFAIWVLQTDFACGVYMFEQEYVEYLVLTFLALAIGLEV